MNDKPPFWRSEPLSEIEQRLLDATLKAHALSADRANISMVTLINCARGSGDYVKSIIGALSTLGGYHAPIQQTYGFLSHPNLDKLADQSIAEGMKLPGFGNSFAKGKPDEIWADVAELLAEHYPELSERLSMVTRKLHDNGKEIYPNPSAYTVMVAIALGIPAAMAVYLLVIGRIESWSAAVYRDSFGNPHKQEVASEA